MLVAVCGLLTNENMAAVQDLLMSMINTLNPWTTAVLANADDNFSYHTVLDFSEGLQKLDEGRLQYNIRIR